MFQDGVFASAAYAPTGVFLCFKKKCSIFREFMVCSLLSSS